MNNSTMKAITHAGKFHADDVFSTALLKIIYPELSLTRTFEVDSNFDGIVYDIGGGEFDHHQEGARVRENGIPYASFGLLWEKYGKGLVGEEEASRFDERFIQPIDEDDNTGCGSSIASIISSFNPSWDSNDSYDECFFEAVEFAKTILTKKFNMSKSMEKAKTLVEHAYENSKDQIVILPQFAPWKMVLCNTDTEFVIYPSNRGGYNAQGVPKEPDSNENKYSFPEEWAGKSEAELPTISGVQTLTFCHNSRFLIATKTLEDAILACRITKQLHRNE
ncbi:MYG1 family protein [Anaeromicropila herbilytica]|uniref:Metal-dependent hydrolase n=1 Tax=Anaeromicropila herbilytica TaxID=2785025 RepID=A0A7R7ELF1_9FIRM|nr:MYG1 family protein [Anaeromicropila herbilytica]BCN31180.1 metal-dependent hydrolase [Anaeromicropila herbilytica]